jgi:hypothetical protein
MKRRDGQQIVESNGYEDTAEYHRSKFVPAWRFLGKQDRKAKKSFFSAKNS